MGRGGHILGSVMNKYLLKNTAVQRAEAKLREASSFYSLASRLRELISAQSGNCGGVNPYPISGGICKHWDRGDVEAVIAAVHSGQDCTSEALRIWTKEGGMRLHTFRRVRDRELN
jgi:hypothetical protein